jgi:hypothetical protein
MAGFLGGAFLATFALTAETFRGFATCFLLALVLLTGLLVSFWAFFAGAFDVLVLLARDLGRVDFGLTARLLTEVFGADRREPERLIPFVTGLLI